MTESRTNHLITGALPAKATTWSEINWNKAKASVFQLQVRIAKAERLDKKGKVKALQRLLTSSFYGKCLAVKRVTSTTGGKTPGVDRVSWSTDLQKIKAVNSLKRRDYKPLPTRRIYIPKKSGGRRPLSIPTMKCRAMQALHLLPLEPIVENRADPNAYGFRMKRSTHDAIEQCFKALAKPSSATFVLEVDIRDCFGQISHDWLMENIPMDKQILRKFLKAGYMENGRLNSTERGTPQGAVISPALTVLTLSGLEAKLRPTSKYSRDRKKINTIAYADDFVCTAASEELLQNEVKPKLVEFLREVGLELSKEKSKITPIENGFEFLGFTIRKYENGKLIITPSKDNIRTFLRKIKALIRKGAALPTDKLIHMLNSRITGWTNYYRSVVSSKVFSKIDHEIFMALKRWALKRHARKGIGWIMRHYWKRHGGNNWRFCCSIKDKNGVSKPLLLKLAAGTKIQRHIKIVANANPFDPVHREYFRKRERIGKQCYKSGRITNLTGWQSTLP